MFAGVNVLKDEPPFYRLALRSQARWGLEGGDAILIVGTVCPPAFYGSWCFQPQTPAGFCLGRLLPISSSSLGTVLFEAVASPSALVSLHSPINLSSPSPFLKPLVH